MKISIKKTEIETIEVTPKILAQCFYEMNDGEQREFFEEVAKLFDDGNLFYTQIQGVVHYGELSENAKMIMRYIGEAVE